MINITFIVPYPEVLEKVKSVIENHELSSKKEMQVSLSWVDHLDKLVEDPNCDVLIARGFASFRLRRLNMNIPVVELPITTCDIIRAVQECLNIHQARHIALMGPYFSTAEAAVLDKVLPCTLTSYDIEDEASMELQIQKAIDDGCDALIGGNTARECAERLGCPAITVRTGENAIRQALDEAVRVVGVMHRERERSQLFSIITNCSKDGILYVSDSDTIQISNPASVQALGGAHKRIVGTNIAQISQVMSQNVTTARREEREISNQLYRRGDKTFSTNYLPVVVRDSVAGVVVTLQDITRIQQTETQIRQKLSEKGLNARYRFADIIHKSRVIDRLIETARRYAAVSSNVLIEGETGTGKELFAQSMHNASPRSDGPFVAINCAAIPENLLESEMFGYEEGAFTGTAKGGKIGLVELAHNGTLFLDEVSELPPGFQGKLLRVLQEREVRRVGGNKVKTVDVRIIAAANCSLKRLIPEGRFRKDLFYRLDVLNLFIPPLSDRPEDIETLFRHFLMKYNAQMNGRLEQVEPAAIGLLCSHRFEGNVRELKNTAERVSILSMGSSVVTEADVRAALYDHEISRPAPAPNALVTMRTLHGEAEQDLIMNALESCSYNQTRAAHKLGIDRTTLWRKMQKYDISLPKRR